MLLDSRDIQQAGRGEPQDRIGESERGECPAGGAYSSSLGEIAWLPDRTPAERKR